MFTSKIPMFTSKVINNDANGIDKTSRKTSERGYRVYTPRNDKEDGYIDLDDDVRIYEATCEPPGLVSTSFEANRDDSNNRVNNVDEVGATWSKPSGPGIITGQNNKYRAYGIPSDPPEPGPGIIQSETHEPGTTPGKFPFNKNGVPGPPT